MKIKIIEENEINPEFDKELRNALCQCFPDDVELFLQSRSWHGSAPAWSAVIIISGSVAAHVGIVDRTIQAGTRQMRVAGIQNVFILPEYRGKGFCEEIMASAMKEAKRRNFEAGLLYCVPQLEKVYARCGWRLLPERKIIRIDENGKHISLPAKNITMLFPLSIKAFPEGPINLQGNDW
jgi:GNAT superfamily N-acetyltransferase